MLRIRTTTTAEVYQGQLPVGTVFTSSCGGGGVAKPSLPLAHGKQVASGDVSYHECYSDIKETKKQRVKRTLPLLAEFSCYALEPIKDAFLVCSEMCDGTLVHSCKVCGFSCSHSGSINTHMREGHAHGTATPVYDIRGRMLPIYKKTFGTRKTGTSVLFGADLLKQSAAWLMCIIDGEYCCSTTTAKVDVPNIVLDVSKKQPHKKLWFCRHPTCSKLYASFNLYHARRHFERCHVLNSNPNVGRRKFFFDVSEDEEDGTREIGEEMESPSTQAENAPQTLSTAKQHSIISKSERRQQQKSQSARYIFFGEWNRGCKVLNSYMKDKMPVPSSSSGATPTDEVDFVAEAPSDRKACIPATRVEDIFHISSSSSSSSSSCTATDGETETTTCGSHSVCDDSVEEYDRFMFPWMYM